MPFNNKIISKILIHLLFWLLFVVVSLFIFSKYYWTQNPFLQYVLLLIVIVYFNNLVLLPFFIKKKWYLLYILIFGLVSFLATQIYCNVFAQCGCSIMKCLSDYLWQSLVPLIFFSFVWMIFRFNDAEEHLAQAKKEHQAMELKFLKTQINPHVLFNNLNTIYSYALEKPEETPDMILKLSDNLKHVLYESNAPTVSLAQEMQFIDNYITFQKVRTEGVKEIVYQHTSDKDHYQIAPLLLITIIENAFKHSTLNSLISIKITAENHQLSCTCINDYDPKKETDHSLQIGLKNLQKRLQLLYPNQHTFIKKVNEKFSVTLKIPLQ